jgi:hypothetical protein
MSALETLAAALWLILPALALFIWYRSVARALEAKTIPHLRTFKVVMDDGSTLDGARAQVLKRTKSYYTINGEAENFTVTEILKSPEGVYFLVKATPSKGVHYCKVLQRSLVVKLLGTNTTGLSGAK